MTTFPARESIRMISFYLLARGKWRRAEFFRGPQLAHDQVSQSFDAHYDDARANATPERTTIDDRGRVIVSTTRTRWVIDFAPTGA